MRRTLNIDYVISSGWFILINTEILGENAHPNYLGILNTYAENHKEGIYTLFGKHKSDVDTNYSLINDTIDIFEEEYNEIWPDRFNSFIKWLEYDDLKLERRRNKKIKKDTF